MKEGLPSLALPAQESLSALAVSSGSSLSPSSLGPRPLRLLGLPERHLLIYFRGFPWSSRSLGSTSLGSERLKSKLRTLFSEAACVSGPESPPEDKLPPLSPIPMQMPGGSQKNPVWLKLESLKILFPPRKGLGGGGAEARLL